MFSLFSIQNLKIRKKIKKWYDFIIKSKKKTYSQINGSLVFFLSISGSLSSTIIW